MLKFGVEANKKEYQSMKKHNKEIINFNITSISNFKPK